jgi:hypothetical protein
MKRFLTLVAAAMLTTAFATSADAAWGPNGMYGNPVGPPVGQSSTPSNHPASAPITTPFNPNADLGAVPGSYKDPAVQSSVSKAELARRYKQAQANFDKKQYSPRLAPQNFSGSMGQSNGNRGQNTSTWQDYNMGRYGTKYGTYTPANQRPSSTPGTYGGMNTPANYGGYGMFAR